MFCCGSSVSDPSPCSSNCMNTRFQYSRKRSVSSPGRVVVAPEVRAAVEVQLRARAARAGRARLPDVPPRARRTIRSLGKADRPPHLDRLVVGADVGLVVAAEDRDRDPLGVEAEAPRRQLPRVLGGALLEVVADGEVPDTLKNVRCRAVRPTFSMSVVRQTFWHEVNRGDGGCSSPLKYGLNGCMPAVVSRTVGSKLAGTSDAAGYLALVRALLEERQVPLANLRRLHRPKSRSQPPSPICGAIVHETCLHIPGHPPTKVCQP